MSSVTPKLRGLLASQLKRDFTIATGLGILAAGLWQGLVKGPRAAKYEEFYKTFDAQKDFERMKKAGVFTSVNPDGSVGDGW